MREAGRATVMDALPDALPDDAVIVVMPLLLAVTNPFVFTVAHGRVTARPDHRRSRYDIVVGVVDRCSKLPGRAY